MIPGVAAGDSGAKTGEASTDSLPGDSGSSEGGDSGSCKW